MREREPGEDKEVKQVGCQTREVVKIGGGGEKKKKNRRTVRE